MPAVVIRLRQRLKSEKKRKEIECPAHAQHRQSILKGLISLNPVAKPQGDQAEHHPGAQINSKSSSSSCDSAMSTLALARPRSACAMVLLPSILVSEVVVVVDA